MRIISMDLDSIVLLLFDMDFSLEENLGLLEDKFRDIFVYLRNLYNIEVEGYYKIDIYKDKYYGIVVEINKEEIDYFDYFDNQIDMRISIHDDNVILYEFDDYFSIPSNLLEKLDLYLFNNKLYGTLIDNITKMEGAYLQEYSLSFVYGSMTRYIIQKNHNIKGN